MPSHSEHENSLSLQRLLGDEEDVEFKNNGPSRTALNIYAERKRPWCSWAILHLILICTYTTLFIGICTGHFSVKDDRRSHRLPLPAREALKPESRYFPIKLEGNAFAGAPCPELESAWHELLQNDNIHLPRIELDQLGLSSVYIKDGTSGIASLSFFHSLHCLKLLRRMMYKEHYHANKSGLEMQRQTKHADHCVEYLRETLMCKPDISLVTFRWINNTTQHPDEPAAFYPTNFDVSPHECMNWEAVNDWAEQRAFNLYDVDLLDRPML